MLAKDGVIEAQLADAVQAAPLGFLDHAPVAPPLPFARQKAPNAIRTTLLQWLDVPSFYELDRLHLEADGTIDVALQSAVERLFDNLADKNFVRANGLTGERLLRNADPTQVVYSLMLFERTPHGNLLRVNADNLERPFDINGGVKLDLGSTAKLRTLAHYLEIVALLHHELQPREATLLAQTARDKRTDPITAWAADTLRQGPGDRPSTPSCRRRSTASTRPTRARPSSPAAACTCSPTSTRTTTVASCRSARGCAARPTWCSSASCATWCATTAPASTTTPRRC